MESQEPTLFSPTRISSLPQLLHLGRRGSYGIPRPSIPSTSILLVLSVAKKKKKVTDSLVQSVTPQDSKLKKKETKESSRHNEIRESRITKGGLALPSSTHTHTHTHRHFPLGHQNSFPKLINCSLRLSVMIVVTGLQ